MIKVSLVKEGSQAERIGLNEGDALLTYNAVPVNSKTALHKAVLGAIEEGLKSAKLSVSREGKEIELEVFTGEPLGINYYEIGVDSSNSVQGSTSVRKTEYGVARGVSFVISFVGWLLVITGAIVTVMAIANGVNSRHGSLSLMAVLPGLGTAVGGFLLIMGAQVTRATVDNADHTREILIALKRA